MLSKNRIKYLQQLNDKKFRKIHGEFIIEGAKIFEEAIKHQWDIKEVYVSEKYLEENANTISSFPYLVCNENQLKQIGNLETNQQVAALVKQKQFDLKQYNWKNNFTLVLDNIKDPGNLGTIIRTANWFGIKNIICSEQCVELYNPKLIQASMGAFFSTQVYYFNLETLLNETKSLSEFPVFGAYLLGENPKKLNKQNKGFLILGSESHGISNELETFITHKITIPKNPNADAESLNVGIACGILCYEIMQQA